MKNSGRDTVKQYILKHITSEDGDYVARAVENFGISKSTVHTDVTQKLSRINPPLSKEVRAVLDENKAQRHIRGGMATRKKYKLMSEE